MSSNSIRVLLFLDDTYIILAFFSFIHILVFTLIIYYCTNKECWVSGFGKLVAEERWPLTREGRNERFDCILKFTTVTESCFRLQEITVELYSTLLEHGGFEQWWRFQKSFNRSLKTKSEWWTCFNWILWANFELCLLKRKIWID